MIKRAAKKVVLTGGPGGGKTTAADIIAKTFDGSVVVIPEAAMMLYSGGFPRVNLPVAKIAMQKAIFHVQKNLEDLQAELHPNRVMICDRGTVDGAVYWPHGQEDFCRNFQTTLEQEFERYDAVVFFETAAAGNRPIRAGNPLRWESLQEAIELDERLRALWSQHANFYLIKNEASFMNKLSWGVELIQDLIEGKSPSPHRVFPDSATRY